MPKRKLLSRAWQPMPDVVYCSPVPDEISDVVELASALHQDYGFSAEFNREWKRGYLQRFVEEGDRFLRIARCNDTIWGYVAARREPMTALQSSRVHLLELYVDPSSRGCRIGTKLVSLVVEWASTASSYEVLANVSLSNQHRARNLFERAGFVPRTISMVRPL